MAEAAEASEAEGRPGPARRRAAGRDVVRAAVAADRRRPRHDRWAGRRRRLRTGVPVPRHPGPGDRSGRRRRSTGRPAGPIERVFDRGGHPGRPAAPRRGPARNVPAAPSNQASSSGEPGIRGATAPTAVDGGQGRAAARDHGVRRDRDAEPPAGVRVGIGPPPRWPRRSRRRGRCRGPGRRSRTGSRTSLAARDVGQPWPSRAGKRSCASCVRQHDRARSRPASAGRVVLCTARPGLIDSGARRPAAPWFPTPCPVPAGKARPLRGHRPRPRNSSSSRSTLPGSSATSSARRPAPSARTAGATSTSPPKGGSRRGTSCRASRTRSRRCARTCARRRASGPAGAATSTGRWPSAP